MNDCRQLIYEQSFWNKIRCELYYSVAEIFGTWFIVVKLFFFKSSMPFARMIVLHDQWLPSCRFPSIKISSMSISKSAQLESLQISYLRTSLCVFSSSSCFRPKTLHARWWLWFGTHPQSEMWCLDSLSASVALDAMWAMFFSYVSLG